MGLSGLLHGLIMMGIIEEIREGNMFYCIGLFAIVGKLAIEQFAGSSNHTSQFITAYIITNAHLVGAITGGIVTFVIICTKNFTQQIPQEDQQGPTPASP